jgi:tetratricopeptide (TPR) repeat protein
MAKRKNRGKLRKKRSGRSRPQALPKPKSHKWLLIFCVAACVVIAGLWGIKSLLNGNEKTQQEKSPPISGKQPKPSTVPSKLTHEEEIAALKKEEFELAEQLMREFPDSADPFLLMGNVQRKHGNSTEAVKYWTKALELNPERPDAYDGMGWIAFEKAEYEEALAFWRKALDINPEMPAVHNSIAQTLIILGRYREVIKEAEEELKVSPRSGLSYFLLGQGHLKLNEYDEAKKYYEKAIELQPDYMNAYYGLFTVCSRLKLQDEAKKYLETFKKLKAEERQVLMDRNKVFDDIIMIRSSLAETYSDVGQVYQREGYLQETERLLQRALTLDPDNAECLMKLGAIFQASNRLPDALRIYEKVVEIEPDNVSSCMNMGVISMQLKQFDNAEKVFKKVITLSPEYSSGYRELAQLYLITGTRFPEAVEFAKKAVELEEIAANYFILSWACDKNGDVASARSALKRAVELEPDNLKYRQMYELIQKRDSRDDS